MNYNAAIHTTIPRTSNIAVTVGPDPQSLIRKAIQALGSAPLRSFLSAFFAEDDIYKILTMPVGSGSGYRHAGQGRYGVQALRAAAETAAYGSEYGGAEREAIYVATFIEGCRSYLRAYLSTGATAEDVLHTLVHEPLRRLDRQDERLAGLVRMCMGWGLPDEVDDFYVPRLRNSVLRSLQRTRNAHHCVGNHSSY